MVKFVINYFFFWKKYFSEFNIIKIKKLVSSLYLDIFICSFGNIKNKLMILKIKVVNS